MQVLISTLVTLFAMPLHFVIWPEQCVLCETSEKPYWSRKQTEIEFLVINAFMIACEIFLWYTTMRVEAQLLLAVFSQFIWNRNMLKNSKKKDYLLFILFLLAVLLMV